MLPLKRQGEKGVLDPHLKDPTFYRARAHLCEKNAKLYASEERRDMLLDIALRWHRLADEAETARRREATDDSLVPSDQEGGDDISRVT